MSAQNPNAGHHHHRDGGGNHQQGGGGGGAQPQGHHQQSGGGGGAGGAGSSSNLSKENKSFNDRFRAFFKGLSKGTSVTTGGASGYPGGVLPSQSSFFSKQEAFILTEELVSDLSQNQAIPTRIKALQTLWVTTNDLFSHPDASTRHAIFSTFTTLIQFQFEKAGVLRARVFTFVKGHGKVEDTQQRFQLLKALTKNGRDATYFEEKMGIFLHTWMIDARLIKAIPVQDFMEMLTNLVKFNCSFLDDDVLGGIIQNTCIICLTTTTPNDTIACINLLNTIVMYSMIPPSTLQTVIATLCRTVNVDSLCKHTWKVMRNLLGTHLGHSGLYMLILFMNETESTENDINSVIRGAVFFTGVVLWGGGNRVVRSLLRGGSGGAGVIAVVLAAYVKCLRRSNPLVTYEVLMRVQDLVKNNADSLQVMGWDLVLEIMGRIVEYSRSIDDELDEDDEEDGRKNHWIHNSRVLIQQIHDTLDGIEAVLDTKTFCGNVDKYWELVDLVCHSRPIPSVEKLQSRSYMKLLNASFSKTPTSSFMQNLTSFTVLHFQTETRVPLRLKSLALIQKLCLHNQDTIEELLLDNVILPNLKNIELEPDLSVRNACVSFIVEFLMESRSKKGHDLLHYLEKVVNRPFEPQPQLHHHDSFQEPEVTDIILAVKGIVKIFQRKLYSLPSSIAVTAYKILVRHLSNHYKRVPVLDSCSSIRYMIFECFFNIRANALYHLGFPNDDGVIEGYSSYLAVDHAQPGEREHEAFHWGSSSGGGVVTASSSGSSSGVSPPIQQVSDKSSAPSVSYISLTAACKQVICCLKKERDWKILELVLLQLPHVMENKALILSKHGNDVDVLATHLCNMVTDKSYYDSPSSPLRNTPRVFSRSDFQAYVFPALTSLVSYHSILDTKYQQQIVKCLEHGLVSKSARICISALTTCTLEMKDTMHKLIPEILLSLSKISPKLNIAVPVLEFLSTLIHLPRVFASFVQDQYMSIFAICLPYTNPFKFNHYVVSLAHHVIALWFLKCRLRIL
ncbi:Tuberin, partial [Orchesella cincta]